MRVSFAFVTAVLLLATPALAQEAADPAAQLYLEGADLASRGEWSLARDKFQAAVALRATAVGSFNLAQAERNLGLVASAKRHFISARALAEREGADDVRRLADEALASLGPRVPRVSLRLPRDAAKVEARVGDRPVEIVEGEIELDPGSHRLTISAAGEKPFVHDLRLAEGERRALDVRFERQRPKASPPPPAPAKRPAPRVESARSGPPTGAIVLAGIGVASLSVGAVLHVRRNDKLDDAAAGCTRTGAGWSCPSSLENDPAHRELKDDANRAELWRNVAFGVGASALAAGGVWWALDGGSSEQRVAVSVGTTTRVRWHF